MTGLPHPLEDIKIASPCRMDWNAMTGDERTRLCGACRMNVYNLSAMTRPEAEALLTQKEGRLCVRLFRRKDGTVMTRDCPVGVRALRRARALVGTALAAMVGALSAMGFHRFKKPSILPTGSAGGSVLMGEISAAPSEQVLGKISPK